LDPALGALSLETGVDEVALASSMLDFVLVVITTIPALVSLLVLGGVSLEETYF